MHGIGCLSIEGEPDKFGVWKDGEFDNESALDIDMNFLDEKTPMEQEPEFSLEE